MAQNIYDQLKERGLIKQTVYEDELRELLSKEKITCYIGFDPSADSLHVGNLATLMLLMRMQMAGHRPIALVGGATGLIGDPSGRNDMRPMIDEKQRARNIENIKAQFEYFLDSTGKNAVKIVNNADWICNLNYVDFLNIVGLSMSVNRMLSHDCFKSRMENGLTFLEFNYMPMQAYDFWHLNKHEGCVLEIGGDDQWANILAGVELVRKKEGKDVFAFTVPLLTKADGTKMGKSAGGAVWLDRNKFSDYDFFQYFRDIEDAKVEEVFRTLTFVPLDEIKQICSVRGKELNASKERLAYEITKIVRGEDSAKKAMEQARASFAGDASNMQTISVESRNIIDIILACGVAGTRGDAKRLIDGKAIKVDDQLVESYDSNVDKAEFVFQKGKKVFYKVVVK